MGKEQYMHDEKMTFYAYILQEVCHSDPSQMLPITVVDQMFSSWFPTDNLAANLRQVVDCVYLSSHESASSDGQFHVSC